MEHYIYIYMCVCVCGGKGDLGTKACSPLSRLIAQTNWKKVRFTLRPSIIICLPPSVNVMWTIFHVRKYTSTNRPRLRLDTRLQWTWCPSPISNTRATMMTAIG